MVSTNEEVSLNFLASGPEGRNHFNPPTLLIHPSGIKGGNMGMGLGQWREIEGRKEQLRQVVEIMLGALIACGTGDC